ncbi:hypothetical protein QAD02_020346 [Eretmocerus hayati]|uniref:Uncharacterized protein n=1 Tax=Eretmocerus hayati TaxID=131215 RepID=A0ACC2PMM8_9HYME|nr:hypothetical protein QAD02_020346 [Eretmocerus hayati]
MFLERNNNEVNQLVGKYFHKDYSHAAIIKMLHRKYNITISQRTLSRITAELGLKRKNIEESPLEHVIVALAIELDGSGRILGYRAMWQRIRKVYRLRVRQKTVWQLLREMDPEGVENRLRYRLRRREYEVSGPNDLWHGDNHDK